MDSIRKQAERELTSELRDILVRQEKERIIRRMNFWNQVKSLFPTITWSKK